MSTNPDQVLSDWLDELAQVIERQIRGGDYKTLMESHPNFKTWYADHYDRRGRRYPYQLFKAFYPHAWRWLGSLRDSLITEAAPVANNEQDLTSYGNVRTPDDHRLFLEHRAAAEQLMEQFKPERLAALSIDELDGLIDRLFRAINAKKEIDEQIGAMSASELTQAAQQVKDEIDHRKAKLSKS